MNRTVETRAAWCYPDHLLTRERAGEFLEPLVRANLNLVIAEAGRPVWPALLEAAHERGMEIHAMFHGMDTFMEGPNERMQVWPLGRPSPQGVGCPSHPAVREMNIQRIVRFLQTYPEVDGVHLDWIGFDSDNYHGEVWLSFCYCSRCRAGFQGAHGVDPREIVRDTGRAPALTEAWKRWRAEVINDYARQIREAMKAVRPDLILSATAHLSTGAPNIFEEPFVCSPNFQEWGRWMAEGIMDCFFPMAYTSDRAAFQRHVEIIRRAQEKSGRKSFAYTGLGVWYVVDADSLLEQLEMVRAAGLPGFALFPVGAGNMDMAGRGFWQAFSTACPQPASLSRK